MDARACPIIPTWRSFRPTIRWRISKQSIRVRNCRCRGYCPIYMFEGRYDLTTPSQVTADWFKRVHAPKKGFVWFENSAHMIEVEEPGRVLLHLVEDVRPLAETGLR